MLFDSLQMFRLSVFGTSLGNCDDGLFANFETQCIQHVYFFGHEEYDLLVSKMKLLG